MTQQHDLPITYKARYFTAGQVTENTRQIWFVLHGYGQLAEYFIRKFSVLQKHDIYIIAPEGLSTFYLDPIQTAGRISDRVGASWMTKENRLTDIENYLNYLNLLSEKEIGMHTGIPVTVLGFSQGAATASRWISDGKVPFSRLILWAGIFPGDMDFQSTKQILSGKETVFVYGKQDPFVNDSRFAEMTLITGKLGITPATVSFDGKHEIDEQTLLRFV